MPDSELVWHDIKYYLYVILAHSYLVENWFVEYWLRMTVKHWLCMAVKQCLRFLQIDAQDILRQLRMAGK
jgi:hypothetical protein